jgi:CDP-glucose 4,6-dehydratase
MMGNWTKNSKMFGSFYKDKPVLLTGHTGFKGSWLGLWLNQMGAKVTGLALPPHTDPSHFNLIHLEGFVEHIEGDVRDYNAVQTAFERAQPEIVFHLAAQAIVRKSYEEPKATFETNINGTLNILEAVRHCPTVKAVVIVTSDKCYENREWTWGYRENDPLGGYDPYSASKGATEIICAAYLRSFFSKKGRGPHLGLATARAGNVIGGGDWGKDRIIPDCVRALSEGRPITIRNPQATRPWQHVLDPLAGYLLLAKALYRNPDQFSGPWNFGPQVTSPIAVKELVERFITAWGNGTIHVPENGEQSPHEAHSLHLSIEKAAFGLKWHPVLESSAAIDWTAEWYKAWHKKTKNILEETVSQIAGFENLCIKEAK